MKKSFEVLTPKMARAVAQGARYYMAQAAPIPRHGPETKSVAILFHRILPLFPDETLRRAERLVGPPLCYPDGSLQFDIPSRNIHVKFVESLSMLELLPQLSDTWMQSLAPFPPNNYTLFYGHEYQLLLGEPHFQAGVGNVVWPGEYQLADMLFTVWFRRRPPKTIRMQFVRCLSEWLSSMSSRGLSGEGHVSAVSTEVEFRGGRADVYLNLSRTGMNTILWLLLTALEFGHAVAPIESAVFNHDDPESIRAMIESIRASAKFAGSECTDADIERWRITNSGGAGPVIKVSLST